MVLANGTLAASAAMTACPSTAAAALDCCRAAEPEPLPLRFTSCTEIERRTLTQTKHPFQSISSSARGDIVWSGLLKHTGMPGTVAVQGDAVYALLMLHADTVNATAG